MSAANRRRGHDCERAVVKYLRANGFPDACTTRAKLGHDGATAPGDIDFAPGVCLEVKDVARSAWPSWRFQAVAEAGGRVPMVLRRARGVTDIGAWPVQVPCGHSWLVGGDHQRSELCRWCERTRRSWTSLPFSVVVAALRESADTQEAR